MELTEKYVYQVYLSKSFSKAAKTLFVSQPSLSSAVASKERELGFRIFDRSTKPISLTAEGAVYIEMLEEIIQSENNMHHRVRRLQRTREGSIAVGSSCYTAYYLLPTACGVFYRRYPQIDVRLDIGNVSHGETLWQKLDQRDLDIIFTYDYNKQKYHGVSVWEERMVVAMHKSLMTPALLPYRLTREQVLSGAYPVGSEMRDMTLFHDIPFLTFGASGNTARYMSDILGYYSVSAHSVANARHSGVHYNMMCAGLGALLTPDSALLVSAFPEEQLAYFVFPREISMRSLYAIMRKNDVEGENTKRFLSIIQELVGAGQGLSLYCP